MDITNVFIETAEKTKQKLQTNTLIRNPLSKKKSPLVARAFQILKGITDLDRSLREHAAEYIDTNKFLSSYSSTLTERDRDNIDLETRKITQQCNQQIEEFKSLLTSKEANTYYTAQSMVHLNAVIALLYIKLQEATDFFSKQRDLRFKNKQNSDRFSSCIIENQPFSYLQLSPRKLEATLSPKPIRKSVSVAEEELLNLSTTEADDEDDLHLDEQERLILEQENKLLVNKLETNVDQARKIEKKVMEISELQQIFALKVAEQIELIDHNYQSVINAHANVERGNRELQQATRRGVDFRVCVLLFIIVAGFALLFLDWIS